MWPGEDELEEVVSEVADEDEALDDDLMDFDDEEPAGEGTFADESDAYKKPREEKVALDVDEATDVKALLDQVRKSKKAKKR